MTKNNELRKWRAENPEAVRAHNRANYARNRKTIRAKNKIWRDANPEKIKAAQRRRCKKPEVKRKIRCSTLKRKYGISAVEYDAMLLAQGGKCALCPRNETSTRYGVLVVDHDHASGKVRGLLCDPCNHALGILGDNQAGLERALSYLKG